MSKCFIFAGGELGEIKKCDIEEGSYIICADSGLCHAQKLEIAPDVILGDFDSYKGELNYDVEIIRCSPQKDDTDTLMAVKLAISRGYDDIIILGALGGRFDHTIANIQTLKYAIEHNVIDYEKHFGISNVSSRISNPLYGNGSVRIRSNPGNGTYVTIEFEQMEEDIDEKNNDRR